MQVCMALRSQLKTKATTGVNKLHTVEKWAGQVAVHNAWPATTGRAVPRVVYYVVGGVELVVFFLVGPHG